MVELFVLRFGSPIIVGMSAIESPLIRHPLETLRGLARDRRALTDEMNKVIALLEEKTKSTPPPDTITATTRPSSSSSSLPEENDDAAADELDDETIQKCTERLSRVKRKVKASTSKQTNQNRSCDVYSSVSLLLFE